MKEQSFGDTLREAFLGSAEKEPKDAIGFLKADHKKVKGLFKEFEQSEKKAEKKKILDEILMELAVHSSIEEKLIYPLLENKDIKKTLEAYEEHHVVKVVINELLNLTKTEFMEAKAKVLCEMVKHHIKEEESMTGLLAELKNTGKDLEKLATLMKAEKAKLMKKSVAALISTRASKRSEPIAITKRRAAAMRKAS